MNEAQSAPTADRGPLCQQPYRELSKALCVTLVQHMQNDQSLSGIEALAVDLQKLRSWLASCPLSVLTDATLLDSAMGYNNFCLDIVTATSSSQSQECDQDGPSSGLGGLP